MFALLGFGSILSDLCSILAHPAPHLENGKVCLVPLGFDFFPMGL